jgi:NAD(P)H dehydrogenase (quinone)
MPMHVQGLQPSPRSLATDRPRQGAGCVPREFASQQRRRVGLMLMGKAFETGKLVAPEDGPVSWTAHANLADATVIALTEKGRLEGLTPSLTGPEALDLAAIAAIASELIGRKITRVTVTDKETAVAPLPMTMIRLPA